MPSYLAVASAMAASTSVGVNAVSACWPCSRARMMPLSRGISAMGPSCRLASLERGVEPAVDLARVALENLRLVGGVQCRLVDIALGVVVVVAGLRIDALDGADHLRGEQDVLDRDDAGQELDARQVIHAGVEEHVVQQVLGER